MKLRTPSRATCTLAAVLLTFCVVTICAQKLANARTTEETTTKLVTKMIGQYHISQSDISDDVSKRLFDRYLQQLDPQKLYLVQADVDEFAKFKADLDDQVKAGVVTFAYEVFDRYQKRVEERIALAHKLADAKHDFSVDEEMVTDSKKQTWAKTDAEIAERWRKRVKFDRLAMRLEEDAAKIDEAKLDEFRGRLHRRYKNILQTVRQTEKFEKLEIYLSALAHCFDPHSSYLSPESLKEFQIMMQLRLQGIGAALRIEDGYTQVASVVPGGAADKDGRLKVGDKIIGVAQAEGEFTDVVEMKLNRVVKLIRGKKGTKVRLKVKTKLGDVKVYELTRQVIELKSSEVRGEIIDAGKRVPGAKGRIGVVNIPSFYRDFRGAQLGLRDFKSTSRDVRKVLKQFDEQGGVDMVVVDLRSNGGGALTEAIEVSGLFIDKGPVVQIKQSNGSIRSHDDEDAGAAYKGPLVVVINRLSASASEILAGVIKDYKRGIIVGDARTHGKGTVQNVMPVSRQLFQLLDGSDRGALKLTINQFYRVNGDSTQNRGVQSDVALPSLLDNMDLGESFLENALAFDRIRPADFKSVDLVTPEIVAALKQGSRTRIEQDGEFKKTQAAIDRFLKRKNRKAISLNESVLRKERDAEKDDDKDDKTQTDDRGQGPVLPKGHYNDEVLRIGLDYLGRLRQLRTVKN